MRLHHLFDRIRAIFRRNQFKDQQTRSDSYFSIPRPDEFDLEIRERLVQQAKELSGSEGQELVEGLLRIYQLLDVILIYNEITEEDEQYIIQERLKHRDKFEQQFHEIWYGTGIDTPP